MNFGRKVVRRKCIIWYNSKTESEKKIIFNNIAFRICVHLKQGHSINLSKAMTRNELGFGFKLVDLVGRQSEEVNKLKTLLAHN